MDFMHRAAAWLAGGVVFAASCASVLAAAACLPERAILQHALLAMQSPAAAVACALPRPGPQPIPTTAPACAGPGANAHSFAHAGTKPYAAAQHRTANRGRRAYPGRAVPPQQGRGQHLTFGGQHPQQHRLCRRRPAGGGDHRQPAFCRGTKQR